MGLWAAASTQEETKRPEASSPYITKTKLACLEMQPVKIFPSPVESYWLIPGTRSPSRVEPRSRNSKAISGHLLFSLFEETGSCHHVGA